MEADGSSPQEFGTVLRYREVARKKRTLAVPEFVAPTYYSDLLATSASRFDAFAIRDRDQIEKDLPRTFNAVPPILCAGGVETIIPMVNRILLAFIERGRGMSTNSSSMLQVDGVDLGVATTARGFLDGYTQGLNFFAAMSLHCVGATSDNAGDADELEELAFWVMASLFEDALDPDFYGANVQKSLKVAFVGGLALRATIVDLAESRCPGIFAALGPAAFKTSIGCVLDKWVLSLFVGCLPHRWLQWLWDLLILPSNLHVHASQDRPTTYGIPVFVAFALGGLVCAGERDLSGTPALERLDKLRQSNALAGDIVLEAMETLQNLHFKLADWPAERDVELRATVTRIIIELNSTEGGPTALWNKIKSQKQSIVDGAADCDEQLISLAQRTHFTGREIGRMKAELDNLQAPVKNTRFGDRCCAGFQHVPAVVQPIGSGLNLEMFTKLVSNAVPDFQPELCSRLFHKLDVFNVGRLTFVELACGMSALSLGSMDEKLRVCFDMFDSEGRNGLTLKDVGDLCALLFRVALKQGNVEARKSVYDDVLSENIWGKGHCVGQDGYIARRSAPGGDVDVSSDTTVKSTTQRVCKEPELPWRSMFLRLVAAARMRTAGGTRLVGYEDFRAAAILEPALLRVFSWCLPPRPENSDVSSFFTFPVKEAKKWTLARKCRPSDAATAKTVVAPNRGRMANDCCTFLRSLREASNPFSKGGQFKAGSN